MRSHRHLDQVGPLTSLRSHSVLLAAALLVTSGSAQNEDPLAARSKGASSAPVTVYEMADFQCPACRVFSVTVLPIIEREYVQTGKVRWVFINLPLTSLHPNAIAAAEVAMCAARQGRFWPTHDALYQQQAVETDHSKREALVHKIQELVHERVQLVPLFLFVWPSGLGPRVEEAGLWLIKPYPWSAPLEEVRLKQP